MTLLQSCFGLKVEKCGYFTLPATKRSLKISSNIYLLKNLSSIEYMQNVSQRRNLLWILYFFSDHQYAFCCCWDFSPSSSHFLLSDILYFWKEMFASAVFPFSCQSCGCPTLIVQKNCDDSHYLFNFLGKFNFSCIFLRLSQSDQTYFWSILGTIDL